MKDVIRRSLGFGATVSAAIALSVSGAGLAAAGPLGSLSSLGSSAGQGSNSGDSTTGGGGQPVHWRSAGASTHTVVDMDGAPPPASQTVAEGSGTFGPATVVTMFEPKKVPIENCAPKDNGAQPILEYHAVAGDTVRTFRESGDQVYLTVDSALACIYDDHSVTSVVENDIVGGTGMFAGATGHVTTNTVAPSKTFSDFEGQFNSAVNVSDGIIYLQ